MKKHVFILFCVLSFIYGKAQDQLFLKNNTKLQVKIIEVGIKDVKYKLQSNPTGPTYFENKENVSMILYENGQYETISSSPQNTEAQSTNRPGMMSSRDSLTYYGHSNNISLNFFNFFNNEVGLTYQREIFKSHFNIIIPVAFGVEKPEITQSVYFGNNNNRYNGTGSYYTLDKKLFEVGFGINYYPSLTTNVNYFIGPVFKYMQYSGIQTYSYYDYPVYGGSSTFHSVQQSSTLSRYTMSITNGFVIRTKSRITLSLYASLGFKNDVVSSELVDPRTNQSINPINSPMSLFFWSGFNVGFNF